jgi:glycosyltransferase involved in cell wall biosynthesis
MIIITGTYPPEKCGVGDYTYNLLHTEKSRTWHLLYFKDWSLKTFLKKLKTINQYADKVINMQYPSVGYGDSLVPHLLCLYCLFSRKKKFTITIHEYTQYGWKGKCASFIFFLFASRIIFTTHFEQKAVTKIFPCVAKKSHVIKIRSNISGAEILPKISERKYDIGYFGYIIPTKGIDFYIKAIERVKKQNPCLVTYLMGQIQPLHRDFLDAIRVQSAALNIMLILDESAEVVANVLSQTKIAFLPFPDGISERRGSFLAAAQNECIVVTTTGKFVTSALQKCCEIIVNEQGAERSILKILNESDVLLTMRQENIRHYIAQDIPYSWENIASLYYKFLNS